MRDDKKATNVQILQNSQGLNICLPSAICASRMFLSLALRALFHPAYDLSSDNQRCSCGR